MCPLPLGIVGRSPTNVRMVGYTINQIAVFEWETLQLNLAFFYFFFSLVADWVLEAKL